MKPVMRRILLGIVIVALIIAIVPAWHYYQYLAAHVSTDDAYVDGTVALVSSRIPGTVTRLFVEDNWKVDGGEMLLTLDPRDYQQRVNAAQAQLERAQQSVDQLYAQLDAAESGLNLAGSQLRQAHIDYDRASKLANEGVVSKEYYDQATTGLRVAIADRALAEHQLEQARAALGADAVDHARYARPIVQQAKAALEMARLDLSYTEIRAPLSGIITRKSVHVGTRVQPGEPLLAIVPMDRLYVTANFKETQLTDVRVGQPAEVTADIYPGYTYAAHVDSISAGTGAAFALLPPENATGNWVKVVQRVPVKVVLNGAPPPDKPLRIGLSVDVSIDISNTSGALLSSTLQEQYHQKAESPNLGPEKLQFQLQNSGGTAGQPVQQQP
jgi:membrane fusion protein (multidrug efflux system)